jgi:DNA (cytosine-5)-methyltransferase 1
MRNKTIRFIDLFAGLGGIRIGFEQAFKDAGYSTECVLTSEIKEAAVIALKNNFNNDDVVGDIAKIKTEDIPNFDFLLGGFPCQAFSVAGKQRGFTDTRGTLFFEIERILEEKKPYGFLLENVEGIVTHDKDKPSDKIGRTLTTILQSLNALGYKVSWKVLDAQNFGLAQVRNRVYIVGTRKNNISLDDFPVKKSTFSEVMEHGLPNVDCEFSRKLFQLYKPEELYGKSIKDKRGGDNNIHSWDIGLKGVVTDDEKKLMNLLLKERRKKNWAEAIGIDWMDGMPLTTEQIRTFYDVENLQEMLNKLVQLRYIVLEHPKKKVKTTTSTKLRVIYERVPDETKPKGYNIVTGKLSYQYSRILSPSSTTPTLVAMDMDTIGVVDNGGLRNLTLKEGLRLLGYPQDYSLEFFGNSKKGLRQGFDLLGNSVCVPVIKAICERLASSHLKKMNGGKK